MAADAGTDGVSETAETTEGEEASPIDRGAASRAGERSRLGPTASYGTMDDAIVQHHASMRRA